MIFIHNIAKIIGTARKPRGPVRGNSMNDASAIENAWMLIDELSGRIIDFGDKPMESSDVWLKFDAGGGMLFPSFCDSHTHIVYAGSREREFLDKINGLSYEEIAANGGGILNSSGRLADTSEDELYAQARTRLDDMIAKGSGAVEIKSGYGLSLESELKMLRVIARLKESSPALIKATFLGAHAVPLIYSGHKEEYVQLIIRRMLPAVAAEGLADFVDVFCDRGFFSVEDTDKILEAAAKYGMRPKIHANELDNSGGVQIGISHNAMSVDHLERAGAEEIAALAESQTIPTALPGASFFLNMPYAPMREMIEAGLPLAIASDYNPGSSPSGDMRFVTSLACIKGRLTPVQAINAATVNGAHAMDVGGEVGTIAPGMRANFFITKPISSIEYLPYAYTEPLIKHVFLNGIRQETCR